MERENHPTVFAHHVTSQNELYTSQLFLGPILAINKLLTITFASNS